MEVRSNGRKNYSVVERHPVLYMPYHESYGDWRGSSCSFSLFIDEDYAHQALGEHIINRPKFSMQELARRIEHLMSILHMDVTAASPAGPLLGETVVVGILHHIFANDDVRADLERRSITSPQIKRACDIIEEQLASRLTLSELAGAVNMSARHFTRAFRAATGRSPHEYITHRRLDRARALIQEGHSTLAEIADRVSFVSHAHMAATFRKVLGAPSSHFCNKKI